MEYLEENPNANYTGVIAALVVLPISLIVYHFSNADMAVSTFISLGTIIFAAVIRWKLKRNLWFWITLLILTVLHIPIIMIVHWPIHWVHGVVLLPLCIIDLLINLGSIRLVESLVHANSLDSK